MKIIAASDSFKGSLSSAQVADAVEAGIRDVFPSCNVVKLPVADGGEGTVEALCAALGGERVFLIVRDPLGRPVEASYAILTDSRTAVIEMSAASGLTLLRPEERNPMKTSSYGTGEMIADALSRGCRRFLICIGGSATNDAGMGMLSALGFRFMDAEGKSLEGRGEDLQMICAVDRAGMSPALTESEFIVACDVDSPFCGPLGAARVFAPQKGADASMVEALDRGMSHFAEVILDASGKDVRDLPGAGAAGGLGGAFAAFLGAGLKKGADMVLDVLSFDEVLDGADHVFTGEGRLDSQTETGKLPWCVAHRAACAGVPVVAVCGQSETEDCEWLDAVLPVTPESMPLSEAMDPDVAASNIRCAVREYCSRFPDADVRMK